MTGKISWTDRRRFHRFNKENNFGEVEEKKHGLLYFLERYKKRTGLYAGLVIAILIVFFGSNTVLGIEVYGSGNVSDERIESVLAEQGVSIGKFIPSIDLRRCEQLALAELDELSWMGIRASGCVIKVEVSPITEIPEMHSSNKPCNIISTKDAQVVRIENVYAGMLIPMLYDGVRKGELLISGTVKSTTGGDYYVHAMGDIIGRYNETMTFFQPFEDEITVYGESFTRKYLYLFGLRIPLFIQRENAADIEYTEEYSPVNFIGLTLPAGIIYSECTPYSTESVKYDLSRTRELLENKTDNYERNFYLGQDIEIIDRKLTWRVKADGIELTVTYTIEGNIGETQEIMAKY